MLTSDTNATRYQVRTCGAFSWISLPPSGGFTVYQPRALSGDGVGWGVTCECVYAYQVFSDSYSKPFSYDTKMSSAFLFSSQVYSGVFRKPRQESDTTDESRSKYGIQLFCLRQRQKICKM